MSTDDFEASAADIAMKAEAADMARVTVYSYDDCLAGLTLLSLIKGQEKRDAITRMCVEAAAAIGGTFSSTVRAVLLVAGVIKP